MPDPLTEALIALRGGQRAEHLQQTGELNSRLCDLMAERGRTMEAELTARRTAAEAQQWAESMVGNNQQAMSDWAGQTMQFAESRHAQVVQNRDLVSKQKLEQLAKEANAHHAR